MDQKQEGERGLNFGPLKGRTFAGEKLDRIEWRIEWM